MSEIKNSGLDQYGAEPFEQQHFETAGVEGVCVSDILGLNIIDLHTGCGSIGKCRSAPTNNILVTYGAL